MPRRLAPLLLLLFVACRAALAQETPPVALELSGYHYFAPVPMYISDDDARWLRQKKNLTVAVYPAEPSPLVQSTLTGRYRGMNADYLALIQHTLTTRISVMRYADRAQAVAALKAGDVDMVLTGLDYRAQTESDLQPSRPLVHAWPSLVTALSKVMAPLHSAQSASIGIVGNYPDEAFIRRSFPNADIVRYASYQQALNAVAQGQTDYFMGDSLTTSSWLSQEFSLALSAVKYWPAPQKESVFLFSDAQTRLREIINNTLASIDENVHRQIAQASIDKGNLSFLIEPLELTAREKQWLDKNKTLRVIVNPWFAPYTMIDANQDARGVVGDILNLVSLQTGITFDTLVVRSNDEMIAAMKQGNWHIVQAATYDLSRENAIAFTHPFISTRFVTVVKKETGEAATLRAGMTVAIGSGHTLLARLTARHPDIRWQPVENSSVALNLVATGKVDAAVTNQLTARYLSEHYYPDELTWQAIDGEEPAAIGFAVPRSEPELRQILDKALDDIPQKEISQIVSKWIRLPDVKIDTWELYNRPFYLVVLLAAMLVVSTFIWAISLTLEVRKRKRSQRLLEQERNSAHNANQQKRAFLSRMSHEIRTPVSAITGFLELLQRNRARLSTEDRLSVDHAAQASHSLLALIGDILDLEKIESGLLEVKPEWVDVDALINAKRAQFSALTAQKGLALRYDSQLEPGEALKLDPQLLGQVLTNLIGNAVKFTTHGSVTLTAVKQGDALVITVTDTGPGISDEDQARLFSAFSQGASGEHHTGSGLGLAICKALMTQMGGEIALASVLSLGTTVTLRLPVEASREVIPVMVAAATPALTLSGRLRVLIVDDHPSSRLLLQRQLATLGISANEARDGEEALGLARQQRYDLLITDVNMPVMDGIRLTQILRETQPDLTICGLTAAAQAQDRKRCLAAGMNACLFKPVDLAQLAALLAAIPVRDTPAFDHDKVSMLAQGNVLLMRAALQDAQRENHRDLQQAREALRTQDGSTLAQHIHRIKGTAQLLGAQRLHDAVLALEAALEGGAPVEDLSAALALIAAALDELDSAIDIVAA
nr:transporter substrate-binding domain-containing protein [uncultured Enterobacter sp.]